VERLKELLEKKVEEKKAFFNFVKVLKIHNALVNLRMEIGTYSMSELYLIRARLGRICVGVN
jgi:hypothetical protein